MMTRTSERLRQRGVALVFAMIALLILSMGAVALIRSVDTSTLALGNLGFKQSALASGGRGADAAMDWLAARMGTAALDQDQVANGYYASSLDTLDVTGRSVGSANVLALVDWNKDGCKVNGEDPQPASCLQPSAEITVNGDKVRYIITRMCNQPGSLDAVLNPPLCAVPPVPAQLQSMGMSGGTGYRVTGSESFESYNPYYRVVTRTVGPKGTVSYTETLAHF